MTMAKSKVHSNRGKGGLGPSLQGAHSGLGGAPNAPPHWGGDGETKGRGWGASFPATAPPRVCPAPDRPDSATPVQGSPNPAQPGSGGGGESGQDDHGGDPGLTGAPQPTPAYSVMRLASSVQAAVELAEKTR
jgi:hypothetical protein